MLIDKDYYYSFYSINVAIYFYIFFHIRIIIAKVYFFNIYFCIIYIQVCRVEQHFQLKMSAQVHGLTYVVPLLYYLRLQLVQVLENAIVLHCEEPGVNCLNLLKLSLLLGAFV